MTHDTDSRSELDTTSETAPALAVVRRGAANLITMLSGHLATLTVVAVSGAIIPRVLGTDAYGQYTAIVAGLTILQGIATGGFQQVGLRYLPPLWRAQGHAAVVLGSSLWMMQLAGAGLAGLGAVVWLGPMLLPEQSAQPLPSAWTELVLGVLGFLWAAQPATQSLLLPLGQVRKMMGIELGRVSLQLAVVVGSFMWWGVSGVLYALIGLYLPLLIVTHTVVLQTIPLRPMFFCWASLQPYWTYNGAFSVEVLAILLHGQFPIYAVATWVSAGQAGLLAVALHISNITRSFFLAGRRALMPILAEIEAASQLDRLRYWGGLMQRYSVAGNCLAAVGWALLGEAATKWVLGEAFLDVYPCVSVMLIGTLCLCCANTCTGLLYIRGLAGLASTIAVLRTAVMLICLLLVLGSEGADKVYQVCWVYTGTAAFSWGCAYTILGRYGRVWLPLRPTLLLLLPVGLVWPATIWEASLLVRGFACVAFLGGYSGLAVCLKLLPAREVQAILHTVRQRGHTPTVDPPESALSADSAPG